VTRTNLMHTKYITDVYDEYVRLGGNSHDAETDADMANCGNIGGLVCKTLILMS
jgi:hypothetical protein